MLQNKILWIKLKEIDLKIKELKNKNKKNIISNNKINAKFYSMAMNISIELITGIGLGVFLGLLIDNYLQLKPIMFIIFFIVGTICRFL